MNPIASATSADFLTSSSDDCGLPYRMFSIIVVGIEDVGQPGHYFLVPPISKLVRIRLPTLCDPDLARQTEVAIE